MHWHVYDLEDTTVTRHGPIAKVTSPVSESGDCHVMRKVYCVAIHDCKKPEGPWTCLKRSVYTLCGCVRVCTGGLESLSDASKIRD